MLCAQGNASSQEPEEEGACPLFPSSLRKETAEHWRRLPSTVLQDTHTSTGCGFPLTGPRRGTASRRQTEPRRDLGITGIEHSKARIRGNISQTTNGAEIFPTENKFVRLQAGVWTVCEQEKEPNATNELLAAKRLKKLPSNINLLQIAR